MAGLTRREFSRQAALACAALALGVSRTGLASASDGAGDDLAELAGTFKYAGGKRERERFAAAVEDVVSGLNILLQPIARRKLLESQAPTSTITLAIARDGGGAFKASVQRPGKPGVTGMVGGAPVTWKNQYGGSFKIKLRAKNDRTLALTFDGKSSHTESTYRLREDGRTLTLRTKISDPRLPKSLSFSYTYRRPA